MTADYTSDRAWREARRRTRILAPAITAATAPVILSAAAALVLSENSGIPFCMTLWLACFFVPAIGIAIWWQTRILTEGAPLHERALTGMSAVLGLMLGLAALAVTLVTVVIVIVWYLTPLLGLTPELIVLWLLRLLTAGLLLFVLLAPVFMLAGAVLGLILAAVIHFTYRPTWLTGLRVPGTLVVTLVGMALVVWVYSVVTCPPTAPEPEQTNATMNIATFDPSVAGVPYAQMGP